MVKGSDHPLDHDDFGSDVFRHEERLHEAEVEADKSEAVEDACVDEVLSVEDEAQNDGEDEEKVHEPVELVPNAAQVAAHFVRKIRRIFRQNLPRNL